MFLSAPFFLFISIVNLANAGHEKRGTSSFDMSSALSAASALKSKFGVGTATATISYAFTIPGGNLPHPPASLVGPIITGVPVSVIVELAQPALRSSIASEFKAGHTPEWYQTLPTAVKSYIESLQTFIAAGNYDANATQSTFAFDDPTSTPVSVATKVKTTSSKAAAPQATGEVALSIAAAMGILGLAIAL